ncbi:MAG: hypothetical protein ABIH86_04125 [Planctomycetota bacterium]
MTSEPNEPPINDDHGHSDFGRRVIRWTLSIAVAIACVWWAIMRRSLPMVPAGFFIGVAAGILRFKLHLAEIQDADDAFRASETDPEKSKEFQPAISAVRSSLFRYGIALAAMLIAGALGRGTLLPVVLATAVGILTPNLALISLTVKNTEPDTNDDAPQS